MTFLSLLVQSLSALLVIPLSHQSRTTWQVNVCWSFGTFSDPLGKVGGGGGTSSFSLLIVSAEDFQIIIRCKSHKHYFNPISFLPMFLILRGCLSVSFAIKIN